MALLPFSWSDARRRALTAAVLALFLAAPLVAAAEPVVYVKPFEIYSAPELQQAAPGLQSMLASRLAGDGYSVVTSLDEKGGSGALWTVTTSVTGLGNILSLDTVLQPPPGSRAGQLRVYETAAGPEQLVGAIDRVATRLGGGLQEGVSSAAPEPPATGDRAEEPDHAAGTAPAAPTAGRLTALEQALRRHRLGPRVAGEARGIAVSDVDGDGLDEIVVLVGKKLVAFRDQGGEIQRVWAAETGFPGTAYILSATDADGDGHPELFVAGTYNWGPASRAYEWQGGSLAPKGGVIRAFLRAPGHPAEPALLLGLPGGAGNDFFSSTAYRYRWDGAGYQRGDAYPVPARSAPLNVDWFALKPGEAPQAVITRVDERLVAYGEDGSRTFETAEAVKGSNFFIDTDRDYTGRGRLFRPQGRTLGWRDGDGFHLLYYRNHSGGTRMMARAPSYNHGSLVVDRWDGLALEAEAEGPKLTGYIADIATTAATGEKPETVYVALTDSSGILVKKATTRVVAYDL